MNKEPNTIIFGRTEATIRQHIEVHESDGINVGKRELVIVAVVDKGLLCDPLLVTADISSALSKDDQHLIDSWARANVGLAPDESLFPKPPAPRPWEGLSRGQKLDMLAANTSYSLRWLEDCEDPENTGWIDGSISTIAHQVACCLCQWFDLEEGVPASETCDYLALDKFPSRETLRIELEKYLNEF